MKLTPDISLPLIGVTQSVVKVWRQRMLDLVAVDQGGAGSPDYEYDAAFMRRSGWTGADGTYSLPLPDGRTLWLFSDTLLGDVDAAGQRTLDPRVPLNAAGQRFVNNSVAIQEGQGPDNIHFITGEYCDTPCNLFTSPSSDTWFWVNAATNTPDGMVTVLLNEFAHAEGELSPFGRHVALWTARLRLEGDNVRVVDYHRNRSVEAIDSDGATTVWGAAVLEQGPWTYIYGSHSVAGTLGRERRLMIARAPADKVDDGREWRFFDGSEFRADCRRASALPLPVPNEFSVQPLFGSRYLLTFADGFGPVSMSFAASPTGPWSAPQPVWTPPESTDTVFTYNPKAHPAQSDERGLLISYNVNSFDLEEALTEADVYRPRFIRVPWSDIERAARQAEIPGALESAA